MVHNRANWGNERKTTLLSYTLVVKTRQNRCSQPVGLSRKQKAANRFALVQVTKFIQNIGMARTKHTSKQAISKLRELCVPENRTGMARFGISVEYALGVSMPDIRAVGSTIARDHHLAEQLWDSKIHEARILASLVDKPEWVTASQMEQWVADFNSWDLCDQVCGNLFDRTSHRDEKIFQWAMRDAEFVKRAAFAMIAWRAVHDKKCDDEQFMQYFPLIKAASDDNRNFVKKAVNWALRQIGKRSAKLHSPALELATLLAESENKTARWIGKGAVKELENENLRLRLQV